MQLPYGAMLVNDSGDVRLTKGEMSAQEYAQLREEYLLPHREALAGLLKKRCVQAA